MSSPKVIFGFHAVGVRLKTAPKSVIEVHVDASRRDARMRQFVARAQEAGVRLIETDDLRLSKLAGSHGHQGVVARVERRAADAIRSTNCSTASRLPALPLLLVLDGVTDPHNLGACLRVADGAGAHAVIAPQGPRGRHQRDRREGRERCGRDGAVLHGDQPRAHAGRAEGARHPGRRHQRRGDQARSTSSTSRSARDRARRRGRGHAPADAQDLRRAGAASRWRARSRASTSRWRAASASTRRCASGWAEARISSIPCGRR